MPESHPRISLEQWRALAAVVDAGGYAQAAAALNKSQSTLTYAVQKMESLLGVKIFERRGRKAVLTPTGVLLHRRAHALVEDARRLERAATELAAGWETEIRIAAEILFPTWLLLQCFAQFARERPHTRIELYESVLGGTEELLKEGRVQLAICSLLPEAGIAEPLMRMRMLAAAAPAHPLHALARPLTLADLKPHTHLVIRDSGVQRVRSGGWLNEQRWTVSHKATSIRAAVMGLGFAWFAEDTIREELASGALKPLPLSEGAERWATLHLAFADRDAAGPGVRRLAEIIRAAVKASCGAAGRTAPAAKKSAGRGGVRGGRRR